MMVIRSLIFNIFFPIWTLLVAFFAMPLLLGRPQQVIYAGRLWAKGVVIACRLILNIKWEVRGAEHLPNGGYVIAAKHQSNFETIVFYLLCDAPAYILKKELQSIPLFGWYITRIKTIAVDRSNGASALKSMISQTKKRLEEGRQVIIFPEGTRVKYGEKGKYKSGIAAIYLQTNSVIIPMALNSGKCWSGKGWKKQSGTIIFEFLEPIESGLKKAEFMRLLEERIENGCSNLEV